MQTLSRRRFGVASFAAIAASCHLDLWAQAAVRRLLVGYPPGGTLDQTARRVAEAWRKQGMNFIIDNRSGAAGRMANAQLKRERGDGNALLCTHTSALSIYPHVYSKLMYDAVDDFVPIAPVVSATCGLAISSAVPASIKTLSDYVKWVRQTPDASVYASPAAGSMAHFLGFQLSEAASLKLQHVGYRGSAPAMNDLLGGQIPAYMGFVADFLPYLKSGKLRILAVSGDKRSRFLAGVPSFPEQGYATLTGIESYGIFAPPGTPDATVKALYDAVSAAGRDEVLVAGFEEVGLELFSLSSKEYDRYIRKERDAWGPVVKASGFKSEE